MSGVRPWYACSGDPCTCPKPSAAPFVALAQGAASGAEFTNRVWLEWLRDICYGVDFTCTPPPPCEPSELAELYAELYAETDGESVEDWTAILLDGNTAGGWYGNGKDEP